METVVVTGATSGIGFVTALELARTGRNVIALGRSAEKIRARDTEIRAVVPDARIDWVKADFASLADVASAIREISDKVDRIDVLINNAGNQLNRRIVTVDGFEMTYQVNHLVPFLMTAHLLPLVLLTPQPQVITTSDR